MTSSGQLTVNEHLQVVGYDDIYALGDCTALDEEKNIPNLKEHVKLLLTNFTKMAKNQTNFKKYKPGKYIYTLKCSSVVF